MSRELQFIIQSLFPEQAYFESSNDISDLDDEELIRLVKHHRLDGILYKKLMEQSVAIDEPLKSRLAALNQRNSLKMMQLSAALLKIAQCFDQNQIAYIVLKGPVLSQNIYKDWSIRRSRDLDILVRKQDLEKAHQSLIALGYNSQSQAKWLDNINYKELKYHLPSQNILVELHHRFFNNPYLMPLENSVFAEPPTIAINGYPMPVLSAELEFLYIATHAAAHNWSRLTWVLDLLHYRQLLTDEALLACEKWSRAVGLEKIFNQATHYSILDFVAISNESHYILFKKLFFLWGLNSKATYKWSELLQRAMLPYRLIRKMI